ncbi:MAG TPA: lipid A biosynthesis acyltransferase [Chloroflexia bacterium]|nr:lipid A biosynthesis acyltransferase [Chloroflexia bacterium]
MKTYYLMRIAGFLVRFVPPRLAYWLCSVIGGVIFMLNPQVRDAVLDNLGHVLPAASRRYRRKVARKVIRNVVKNYYDVVRLPRMSVADLEKTIVARGMEHLDNALAQGKGVIVVGAHLGNFSVVAQLGAARGYKISIIAEDIKPPRLYDYVNRLRGHFGLQIIKLHSTQVRTIYHLLRNNEVLALAVDRDVTGDGVPTMFFDALAPMPPGAVALALRTGAALISGRVERLPDNSSMMTLDPPLEMVKTGDRDLDLKVNMRRLAQRFEEYILYNPTQWVVLQRVWGRQLTPEGEVAPPAAATGAGQALQVPGAMALPSTPLVAEHEPEPEKQPEDAGAPA